jgi:hypothetical protein
MLAVLNGNLKNLSRERNEKEEYCINTCVVPTESERNVMSAQNDEDRYLIGYLLMIVLE